MSELLEPEECLTTNIPISKVHSSTLINVIEFLNHYAISPMIDIIKPIKTNDMKILTGEW